MHNTLNQVWVVFRESPNNDGVYLQGIFLLEHEARAAARFDDGIMLVNTGEILPNNILDVEKAYYPCYTGTWDNSPHGRWTKRAQQVVRDFFHGPAKV